LTSLQAKSPENFEQSLTKLTQREREDLQAITWALHQIKSSESLHYFAKFVKTKDEHGVGELSIKPFPLRSEKPYLWVFLDACQTEQLLLVEKSRQMMLTWAACLYCFWVAKYRQNRLIFIQSKKEDDAAALVFSRDPISSRVSFMELHLPEELRTIDFNKNASFAQLWFPDTGSRIIGIPEGGEKIRSYTASLVFSDELAFQPDAEEAYKAARPTISGGGQFLGVSSARNGAFMKKLLQR
jgi:hypothetical protein